MGNRDGINDHSGAQAEILAAGYKQIDRRAVYPTLYAFADSAAAQGKALHVLDIGCGSGNDAFELAKLGHSVVGIEPSDLRAIAERDHAHPNIHYRDGLLPQLATVQPCEQFDAVILSAVWQYIDPAERVASLRRIGRLLKPGGRLEITYPSPPSRPHQFEATPEMLARDLQAANEALPKNRKLVIDGAPSILPDSRGRTSLDGRPLNFYSFTLKNGHAQAITPRDGHTLGR